MRTDHPIRQFGRRTALVFSLYLAATVAGCWSSALGILLFIFGLFAFPLSLLVVGTALAHDLWEATEEARLLIRAATSLLFAPTATLVAIALLVPMLWLGTWIGSESLLSAYGSRYAAIIYKVQHTPPPPENSSAWQHEGSITYVADYGSPRRVAFEPGGYLDNWSGIVWDPTHDVMQADGFDAAGHFHAPNSITKLFGGDLVACRRLGGDWFDCSFT